MHTYIQTYIHIIHAYIHTYIHTYNPPMSGLSITTLLLGGRRLVPTTLIWLLVWLLVLLRVRLLLNRCCV